MGLSGTVFTALQNLFGLIFILFLVLVVIVLIASIVLTIAIAIDTIKDRKSIEERINQKESKRL